MRSAGCLTSCFYASTRAEVTYKKICSNIESKSREIGRNGYNARDHAALFAYQLLSVTKQLELGDHDG